MRGPPTGHVIVGHARTLRATGDVRAQRRVGRCGNDTLSVRDTATAAGHNALRVLAKPQQTFTKNLELRIEELQMEQNLVSWLVFGQKMVLVKCGWQNN